MDLARRLTAALALAAVVAGEPALANPASRELRAKATRQIFNLDRDEAIVTFREAIAADPQDAAAYRGPGDSALAEHHVPPRQHDRGRLPGSGDQAERQHGARAARSRGRFSAGAGEGDRARPDTDPEQSPRRRRALPAGRGGRPSCVVHRHCRRQCRRGVPLGPRGLQRARTGAGARPQTEGRRPHRRHVSIPRLDALAPACAGWPTWPASVATRTGDSG